MSWLAIGGGIGAISAGSRSATGQNIIGFLIIAGIFSAPFYFVGQRYFKAIYPVTALTIGLFGVMAVVFLIATLTTEPKYAASVGSFGGTCAFLAGVTFFAGTMFYIGADSKMLVDRGPEVMPIHERPLTTLAEHTGFDHAGQIYRCQDRGTTVCSGGDMYILDDGAIRSLKFWFGRVGGSALVVVLVGWTTAAIGDRRHRDARRQGVQP